MKLYPMKLKPVLKDIIWGGTRLANEYNKAEPNKKIAESWELCVHPNGTNIIENGEYAGKTLEYLFNLNKSIAGKNYDAEKFPVLIKFIDAGQDLSVQVHPDNEYALKNAGETGKTEMWYVIDCKPNAKLVYGLNADYTRQQLETSIQDGTFETCLNYIEVKPGDVFFIPAGLIHAIGEGILLAEIQQNSDTTYRLYDYNRAGIDGKPRELHVKQALDVCVKTKSEYKSPKVNSNSEIYGIGYELLFSCEYFRAEHFIGLTEYCLYTLTSENFASVICLDGKGIISYGENTYDIKKGDSYFIPSGTQNIKLSGRLDLLISTPGKK